MSSKDFPFQYDIGRRSNYVGRGQETQVENFKAYVCQPPFPTDKAVIVVHDIYGWQFPDTRYIADIIAAGGYLIICPDFFLGKAPWTPNDRWQNFGDWLKHRDPMKVDRTADIVMKCLKQQYNVKQIGIVGFSWGGMAVHHLMLTNPELKTGVSAYGIIRDSEERYNLLNPTFFIFGEKDHTISKDQVILLEQKLKEYCQVDYKVKVYPGQVHGFAQCKPEDMKPKDVPYIEEARIDMLEWLNRYLMMANEANPCPCNAGDTFDYKSLGCEIPVEHINAYLCKPSLPTEKAIIVIHDIYGWQLPNTRYIVDMLAANGYLAILPDFYKGQEPWKPSNDWSTFNEWLKTRDAKKINKETDVVLKYVKEQCNMKRIGVIGFCWDGTAVHHLMLSYAEFKTGISVYGVIRLAEDRYNLLNPTFFIFGEKDEVIPLDQVSSSRIITCCMSVTDYPFQRGHQEHSDISRRA